jgi:hypothetical protein
MLLASGSWSAHAVDKGYILLDLGFAFGTKTGMVLGLRYAVLDDFAVGLDVFAAPAVPGGTLGVELHVTYFPPVIRDFVSVEAGMSYTSAFGEVVQDGTFLSLESLLWAINARVCGASPAFLLQPMFQNEGGSGMPTVVYLKVGAARVLASRLTIGDTIVSSGAGWRFPCAELGLRQGPFQP